MPPNDFQHTAIQSIKNSGSGNGWTLTQIGSRMDGDDVIVERVTHNTARQQINTSTYRVDKKGVVIEKDEKVGSI